MKQTSLIFLLAFCSLVQAEVPSTYENQAASWKQHQQLRDNTDFHGIHWRNVGPIVQGGRVVSIVKANHNPQIIYVGYASGGVWKSENNGMTFRPITDHLPSQIVGALAIDPNDDNTLWLGTGENNSSRSSYGGMGVYKSTDAGDSWQYVGLGDSDRIGDILIDPKDSNRVFVAALGKLYSKGGQRGLYATEDGGKTWKTLIKGEGYTGFISLARSANGNLFAAAWERSRSAWEFVEGGVGSALYKSTDNGKSWKKIGNGLPNGKHMGRIGIATAASDANVVYLSIDNQTPLPESEWDLGDQAVTVKRLKNMTAEEFLLQDEKAVENFLRSNNFPPEYTAKKVIEQVKNDQLKPRELVAKMEDGDTNLFNVDIRSLEIYRSDDGGEHFYRTHKQDLQGVVYSYGYYFGLIAVDPSDADVVYTAGVPLIKSTDGGKNWHSIWPESVHADFHVIWIDPQQSRHLMVGNDGGVDESHDGGKTWRKIDQQPVGQFYTVAVDMAQPYNIYGGLQDNGTLSGSSQNDWTKGESWRPLFGGDGMHVNIDNQDKLTYVGYQFGNYFRLGSDKTTSITPPNYVGEESIRKNWNTPVMLSSHNNDILYYAGNKVFRSMNKGQDWKEISADLTTSKKRGNVPFATITSLSESPLKFGLLWVGTDDGLVWVSKDGGENWHNVSKSLPKNKWVSRIIASPHDQDTAWLALNNYRNDDIKSYLYKTENLGKTWQKINNNLPNEAVNVIKQDPKNKNLLYVGTDKGIYTSINRGKTWQMLGVDLPTVPVHDLTVHPRDNELVIGTHGRSVYVADVAPLQQLSDEISNQAVYVYSIDKIKPKPYWNHKKPNWGYSDQKHPKQPLYIWSKTDTTAQLSIQDAQQNKLLERQIKLQTGLNQWQWDYLVNEQLAIAAERQRLQDQDLSKLNRSELPYAEAKRLGHPAYIKPGKYQISVQLDNGQQHQTELIIESAKAKK